MHGSTIDVRTWGETSEKHKYIFPLGSKQHRETFEDMSSSDRAKFSGATYAASHWNVHGIESLTASGHCLIKIATPEELPSGSGWYATGESFTIPGTAVLYKCYKRYYSADMAEEGIPLAIPHHDTWSTIVFASGGSITVDVPAPPCTIIDYSTALRSVTVNNPAIHVLSDGSYLATQTASVKKGYAYRSTDKGSTWTRISDQLRQSYCAVWEKGGNLYLLGCDNVSGSLAIQKSTDKGASWSANTVLFDKSETVDGYHGGSSPFVEKNGRLYRAMGDRAEGWSVILLSASLNSDLENPSSWTMSNKLYYNPSWLKTAYGSSSTRWEEPALIKKADGSLAIIARIDAPSDKEYAALIDVNSDTDISFNRVFPMPGSQKRLTIAYDAQSGKYWTLVSPFYSNTRTLYGLAPSHNRNSMVLMSSTNLVNWTRVRTCIYSDNAFNNSYHYIDWRFDGNDLIAVFRCSVAEPRGLPLSYHDSNAFGFFRVKGFRNGGSVPTVFVDTPVIPGPPSIPDLL